MNYSVERGLVRGRTPHEVPDVPDKHPGLPGCRPEPLPSKPQAFVAYCAGLWTIARSTIAYSSLEMAIKINYTVVVHCTAHLPNVSHTSKFATPVRFVSIVNGRECGGGTMFRSVPCSVAVASKKANPGRAAHLVMCVRELN